MSPVSSASILYLLVPPGHISAPTPERAWSASVYAPGLLPHCGAGVRCRGTAIGCAQPGDLGPAPPASPVSLDRTISILSAALRHLLMREHLFGALIVYLLLVATQLTARDSGRADGENGDPEEREVAPRADDAMIRVALALLAAVLRLAEHFIPRAKTIDNHASGHPFLRVGTAPLWLRAMGRRSGPAVAAPQYTRLHPPRRDSRAHPSPAPARPLDRETARRRSTRAC